MSNLVDDIKGLLDDHLEIDTEPYADVPHIAGKEKAAHAIARLLAMTAIADLRRFNPEQRMEIMSNFCRHCGSGDPKCPCWNDT